jgi:hypothetical protein
MNIILNPLQAFNAMTQFLDSYYKKNLSDDLGILLSSMEFLDDNETVDAATWDDWINILGENQTLTELQAFNAMIKYLTLYADLMDSEDLRNVLGKIELSDNKLLLDDVWASWISCVNNTQKEPENARSYLKFTK